MMSSDSRDQDCAVCLQKRDHPTQLPCGHIFCFLCVKGIAKQSRKCAMCRAEIPPDYLDNPIILENLEKPLDSTDGNEDYQWFYQGRDGWWKYDKRSNIDIEAAYRNKETECTLLIVGELYIIDLQNMVQLRRNDTSKRRRVRRDTTALPAKGIAGIKIKDNRDETKSSRESHEADHDDVLIQDDDVITILDDSHNNDAFNDTGNSSSDVSNVSVARAISSLNIDELDQPLVDLTSTTEDT